MDSVTPAELGRLGGQKTLALHGKDHYRKMQKIGVENRRKRKLSSKKNDKFR